jgi:hypothetical protein
MDKSAAEDRKYEEMARSQHPAGLEGGDVIMGEAGDGEDGGSEDAKVGKKCSRCTKKGHVAASCTADIYCVICDKRDHVNYKCPLLKMPRPVAHAVGYAVHGLGFYHIPRPPLPRSKKESKTATISVEGCKLSKEEVQKQLERLFPGKWVWELKDHEEGSFLAKFPSRMELQRAVAFGGADIKGANIPVGARIKFEVWQEKETGFLLPKVWVKVYGMRKELREFLELWAVGTMLGSTQVVDMEATRKNNYGRILVAVLNPSLIPDKLDVVIADHYFELEFEVEKWGFDENGEEAAFEWSGGVSEVEGEGQGEEPQQETDGGQERMTKKQKIEEINKAGVAEAISWKEQVQNMSKVEFEAFLREKAVEILNKAADKAFDEIADKVMQEEEEGQQGISAEMVLKDNEAVVADKIREAAAVPEASKLQVRSSPRLQRSKDENVMAKAEERAAKRNLEFSGGTPHSPSLLSVNNSNSSFLMQQIGINLGNNSQDRDLNFQFALDNSLIPNDVDFGESDREWGMSDSEEEDVGALELNALKNLCGEVMEEVFDESSFPLKSELDNFSRKGKSNAKSCLRKTCKLRRVFVSKKGYS